MPTDNPKKSKSVKEEIKDTSVRVSDIIDFGQKISNDWLKEEVKKKVQTEEQKQVKQEDDEDSNSTRSNAPENSTYPRNYHYIAE